MRKVRLGKSELMVTKTSFGALPIQRVDKPEAVRILRKAYDSGINYFDSANRYTDSEEKIGLAFEGIDRESYILSTKTGGLTRNEILTHIENSLRMMKTDYIDLIQMHNPSALPDPLDPQGPYAGLIEAKEKGYVRHIGLTNHSLENAMRAIDTNLFETIQFPFSYIASEGELELARKCKEADLGFIAMKGLAGGLLSNARACFAFIDSYDWVVPIWGIQSEKELDEWIELEKNPPALDDDIKAVIEADKKELVGSFCRSCGYCMPCPAGIDIKEAARMNRLLRRSPYQRYMTKEFYEQMHKIDGCLECGSCKSKCPYGLDTPTLLKENLKDYDGFYAKYGEK